MPATQPNSKHRRVEALDLLRLLAALAVVAYHYSFRGAAADDMTSLSLPAIVLVWLAISLANELFLGSSALRRVLVTDDSGFFCAGLMLYALFSGRRSPTVWLLLAVSTAVAALQANLDADWVRGHFGITVSGV